MTDPTPTRAEVEALADGMRLNGRMDVHNMLLALRERAEAAELRPQVADACLVDPTAAVTAAWEAGRDAGISYMLQSKTPDKPAPPADPFAALAAVQAAAWNDACKQIADMLWLRGQASAAEAVDALRRAAPTEGEA